MTVPKTKSYGTTRFRDGIPEKERQKMTPQVMEQYFLWDGILKRLIQLYPCLAVALINAIFKRKFSTRTKVRLLSSEYQVQRVTKGGKKIIGAIRADILLLVGKEKFHLECQICMDWRIPLRMLEYVIEAVVSHGLYRRKPGSREVEIDLPNSAVIYLTHTRNTPSEEICTSSPMKRTNITYRVPTLKVQDYTTGQIREEKLYVLIPFLPLRVRDCLRRKDGYTYAKKQLTKLLNECKIILDEGLKCGDITVMQYRDLTEFTLMACDQIFKDENDADILKEAYDIMEPLVKLSREIIAEQKEQLRSKDEQLENKDKQLEVKEKQLKSSERKIKDQTRKIQVKDSQLQVKDSQLQALEKEHENSIQGVVAMLHQMKVSFEEMREKLSAAFAMTPEAADKEIMKFIKMTSNFGS